MRQTHEHDPIGTSLGVVGGLGALAGADLFAKLMRSPRVLADPGGYRFLFEQHPYADGTVPGAAPAGLSARKFYVYEMCRTFESRDVDTVMLPCFTAHTFREELQAELRVTLLDMMAALRAHVDRSAAGPVRLGVLTSGYVKERALFERYFGDRHALVYPSEAGQSALMAAVYGPRGIKGGAPDDAAFDALDVACRDVLGQGAELVLPGMTELCLAGAFLQQRRVPFVDVNQVYADYATAARDDTPPPLFKLGVVGGVGPAATVDFMGKVVARTPAGRDQDHLKMVVEQNPQIPDRTHHLLQGGADPSVALYATCLRLQQEGAHAIAIPCNTAHAFVARIQPRLRVPIVHMLDETVGEIVRRFGADAAVGLLATQGTVASGVYHEAARRAGLTLQVPEPAFQARVTRAIFGERGVKAGHTTGLCKEDLLAAATHLAQRGARVLILGCTELPLILPGAAAYRLGEHEVALVDPTDILAACCVRLAGA